MRRVFAAFGFVALAGALILSFIVLPNQPLRASAERNATFLIPPSDGYGIAHCLLAGSACGEVVANAWCGAHGYSRAEAFGVAGRDDSTGSAGVNSVAFTNRDAPVSITCID